MTNLNQVFDNKYLKSMERLCFAMKGRAGMLSQSGARKSGAKGSSLEFADFRNYTFSDDVKRIDWNSFARTDKLYLKLFTEEKQMTYNLFLDSSASMSMLGKDKYSLVLAASLAYVILNGTDKLNLYTFDEKISNRLKAFTQKRAFSQILSFLDTIKFEKGTSIYSSLAEVLIKGEREGCVSVIISDFLTQENLFEAVRFLKYRKHDVILVQVLAEEEISPALDGNLRLVDSETNQAFDIEIDSNVINEYKKQLIKHQSSIKEYCKKYGADMICVNTAMPYLKALTNILS